MRNYKIIFKLLTSLLLISQNIKAQISDEDLDDFLGFDDTVNDAADASITSLMLIGIVLAIFIGYQKLQKKDFQTALTQSKLKD